MKPHEYINLVRPVLFLQLGKSFPQLRLDDLKLRIHNDFLLALEFRGRDYCVAFPHQKYPGLLETKDPMVVEYLALSLERDVLKYHSERVQP